jgi:hypothetical protein
MQANDGDSDSDYRSGTHEGGGPGAPANNNAAVHELNRIRSEALRDIDEGGFSCVASLSLPSTCVSPCFEAGFILNYASSPVLGSSRTRELYISFMPPVSSPS